MKTVDFNCIFSEIDKEEMHLLDLLVQLTRIPSPTGKEEQKMHVIQKFLEKNDVGNISHDKLGNTLVKLRAPVNKGQKTILVVAHTDSACDPGKIVEIREDKKYIYGHGICDNNTGVVALLTVLSLIKKHNITFLHNFIFGFTVGEEGLGAKRGMKEIIKHYGKDIDAVINVESHNIGRITNQVIGQYRCSIKVDTKVGGHSFRDFGRPNANVVLAQIISEFSAKSLPVKKGKTTFNVGSMNGEGSINAIATKAACLFEIRSEDNSQLKMATRIFETIVAQKQKANKGVEIVIEVKAETPAVLFPKSHKIYSLTQAVQGEIGIVSKFNQGNTDGDVSLAHGIPTVTIGTSLGWNTHSLDEYMEKASLTLGIKQAFALICRSGVDF